MNYLNMLRSSSASVDEHLNSEKETLEKLTVIQQILNVFRDYKTFQKYLHFPSDSYFKFNQDKAMTISCSPNKSVRICKIVNRHVSNVLVLTGTESKMELKAGECLEDFKIPWGGNITIANKDGGNILYDVAWEEYMLI